MKVSFILPVYKVEAYLRQCVESITCQTYRDIEIILVDDGSPDCCPALCDTLATEDNRIRVIHKENGGLSDARNRGLQEAIGEYVIFCDSDDFWTSNDALAKLVDVAINTPSCDFVGYNCGYYYPESSRYVKWVPYDKEICKLSSTDNVVQKLIASGTFPMSSCLKLIKRSVLVDYCITFKIGQICEDIPWFINLLEKSRNSIFVNEYVYAYRQNVAGSLSSSGSEKLYRSLLDIVVNELSCIDERNFSLETKNSLRSFLAYELSILMALIQRMPRNERAIIRKKLKSLTYLFDYTQNPKVRMVSKVYKLFGYNVTELILRTYNWYRARKS